MRLTFRLSALMLLGTALVTLPVALGQRRLPDLDTEIAMGRQAAREVEQHVTWVQDPVVAEYINRIAQTLVRNSDAKVPFTIRVVDSDEVNAMALPGGFLFVNKGLILATDNESELAGAMAHEIAHVTARHALSVGQIPLVNNGGVAGNAIQQAAQIGVPITFLAFNRAAETEADFLGLQYLFKAGYDPDAMARFFEKLQTRQAAGATVSNLFATHPATEDRIREVRQDIATSLPARAPSATASAEFDAVKARLK